MFAPTPEDLATAQRIGMMPPDKANQEIEKFLSMGGSFQKLLLAKRMLDTQKQRQGQGEVLASAQQAGINTQPTTVAQDIASQLSGVAGLPTRDDMFTAAGGGIVAFNGEDNDQLVQQTKDDAATLEKYWDQVKRGALKTGALAADAVTLVPRGVVGALNTGVVRPLRALQSMTGGIDVPYIPIHGGTESMTPYFDRVSQQDTSSGAPSGVAGSMIARPPANVAGSEYGPGIPSLLAGKAAPSPGAKGGAGAGVKRGTSAREEGKEAQRQEELRRQIAEDRAALEKAVGNRPADMSDEDAQALAKSQREKALKEAGIKSYKERVDELKAEAKTLDKDRDTDRWLALAQGFFAMGAGKSRYALQNMSEGLGVTTTQLRDAEKEYRKAMQAKKAMESALEDAERKEIMGDVAAGRERKRDVARAQERFDEATLRVRSTLLGSSEKQLSESITKEEARKSREQADRLAADARRQAAQIAADARLAGQDPKTLEALLVQRLRTDERYKNMPMEEFAKAVSQAMQSVQPQRFEKPEDAFGKMLQGGGSGLPAGVKVTPVK